MRLAEWILACLDLTFLVFVHVENKSTALPAEENVIAMRSREVAKLSRLGRRLCAGSPRDLTRFDSWRSDRFRLVNWSISPEAPFQAPEPLQTRFFSRLVPTAGSDLKIVLTRSETNCESKPDGRSEAG